MNSTKNPKTLTLELKITDLVVLEERRPDFKKMAAQMTDLADSIGYFDPLEDPDWFVIPPRIKNNSELTDRYIKARREEAEEYRFYREQGIPKEDARFCLPNACKTVITWTFNMNSLIWFLEQRIKKDAQWEIRLLAQKLLDLVMSIPEWEEFLKHWESGQRR